MLPTLWEARNEAAHACIEDQIGCRRCQRGAPEELPRESVPRARANFGKQEDTMACQKQTAGSRRARSRQLSPATAEMTRRKRSRDGLDELIERTKCHVEETYLGQDDEDFQLMPMFLAE